MGGEYQQQQKPIISKETSITVGMVIILASFAYSFGSQSQRIENNNFEVQEVKAEMKDVPTRFELQTIQMILTEIKSDIKDLKNIPIKS